MSDETKPLLPASGEASPAQDYQSNNSGGDNTQPVEVSKSQQTVSCRVCNNVISMVNRAEQHVVKCAACGEATPIRNPPAGKTYVRCPCNCLLICNSSAPRIACPRPNCKRIISVSPTPAAPPVPSILGMARVICIHCKDTFLFNTLKNVSARCPHCRRISSVGPEYARNRGHWYLAGFFIFVLIGATVTGTTYQHARTNSALIGVYVGCFVLSLMFLGRSVYFYTMKVSSISGGSV